MPASSQPQPVPRAADLLGREGPIARAHGAYEDRPQQIAMADAVQDALREKRHAVLEAGTGIGKSFAYLVPAIVHAVHAKSSVVVCTSTISLQEQIVLKDLPFLAKSLDIPFTYALMKGRANYVCLRRLDQTVAAEADFFDRAEERRALERVVEWAGETRDGSATDFDVAPPAAVWERVRSEHENCLGHKSPHYKECFYQAARKRAQKAQIVVVNYALYFADLALRRHGSKFLPDHQAVVFDEAHEVESIAAEHLGRQVTYFQVKHLFDSLLAVSGQRGFLRTIGAEPAGRLLLYPARDACERFFEDVLAWVAARADANLRIREPGFVADPLSGALRKLGEGLANLVPACESEGLAMELHGYLARAADLAASVEDIVAQKSKDQVRWVEIGRREGTFPRVVLKSCPVDVGPVLAECLFKARESVICTSATLATARQGGFDFFRRSVGAPAGALELRLDSPFNYREQATLVLCPRMPDPNHKEAFLPAASDRIVKYVRATQGRAFVLFTSYDLMQAARARAGAILSEWGIRVLMQGGETSRHRMLEEFKAADGKDVVIFGVDSFWQGVDVPGAALSTVILTKLPFPVPSHPLVEAKAECVEREGGSPFEELMVPEAILKLKQGFGRLIRRKDDRGTVVVLDPRVATKGYGRRFLAALPQCRVVYDGGPIGGIA